MKKLIFFFLFSVLFAQEPTICLNMIVKNETKVIERCLESVKPLIDYWVIVDTGSTDGTQELIQKIMEGIPGELHERPWVNFSHNRNEALKLADGKGAYVLFIDADDVLSYEPDFKKPKLDRDAYHLKIKYHDLIYDRTQLVKNTGDWRWEGAVHEVLVGPNKTGIERLEGVTMVIVGGGDRSADPKKFLKDAEILENELKKNPDHARTVFYLAQSYRDAGNLEKAIEVYEKRVSLNGWDQEVFWSLYQIALLKEALMRPDEEIEKAYFKAYQFRPSRAEPLYRLSTFYRIRDNHLFAYLLSKFGRELILSKDALFVESWIYEYGLLFENSISAYWVGKYEESYVECVELLQKTLPQNIRECVERNIRFSAMKLSTYFEIAE